MKVKNARHVWIGDFGIYDIPKELSDTKMTKTGWPDKRYKEEYRKMMDWVERQEQNSKQEAF